MISDLYSWLTLAVTAFAFAVLRATHRAGSDVTVSRPARWATRGLLVLLVASWVFGYPFGVAALRAPLAAGFHRLATADEAKGARTVVVLAGGLRTLDGGSRALHVLSSATALRVLEAARVAAMLGPDTLVIASGGGNLEAQSYSEAEAMRDALVSLGVPRDRILLEPRSRNTREQVVEIAPMLARLRVTDFVLVTSGWHLRRSVGALRAMGLRPIASAAPDDPDTRGRGWHILPTTGELGDSSDALREYLAVAYYGVRGWLAFGIS